MASLFCVLINEQLRRERIVRELNNPLDRDDSFILRYYRFPRHMIIDLCASLPLEQRTNRSMPIPPILQLLAALRFYASGSFQSVIADSMHMSQASVRWSVENVSDALSDRNPIKLRIKFPDSAGILDTKLGFSRLANIPKVIGAVDCTHVAIKVP